MKKLCVLIYVSLLTISITAADLASSYKEAVVLADAQGKLRKTQAYLNLDLTPYYEQKYWPVYQSCLASTEHPDTSPFSFVVAIGPDGRILRIYNEHETNIYSCVRKTLLEDKFPKPPVSPYYMHISMSFGKD